MFCLKTFSDISFQFFSCSQRTLESNLSFINRLPLFGMVFRLELAVICTGVFYVHWLFQAILITLRRFMVWSRSVSKITYKTLLWNPVVAQTSNITIPTQHIFQIVSSMLSHWLSSRICTLQESILQLIQSNQRKHYLLNDADRQRPAPMSYSKGVKRQAYYILILVIFRSSLL